MTEAKIKLDIKLATMLATRATDRTISRRFFLYDFPSVFTNQQDRGFKILQKICDHFNIPFSSVKIAGSSQTGYSYFKNSDFIYGESDLDIAIINNLLFQKYAEEVYLITRGYTDLTKFKIKDGVSVAGGFRNYLSNGYFRPDLMPTTKSKDLWFQFFNTLSSEYTDIFSNINAGIYLSEGFFEMKNTSLIRAYRKVQS